MSPSGSETTPELQQPSGNSTEPVRHGPPVPMQPRPWNPKQTGKEIAYCRASASSSLFLAFLPTVQHPPTTSNIDDLNIFKHDVPGGGRIGRGDGWFCPQPVGGIEGRRTLGCHAREANLTVPAQAAQSSRCGCLLPPQHHPASWMGVAERQ